MKSLCIGILGATGAVGSEMIKILEEKNISCKDLRVFAAPEELGTRISFKNKDYFTDIPNADAFEGMDILFSAVSKELSNQYSPIAVEKGAIVIDNSSAYRLDENVPLIVPEVNAHDISKHRGIIANPNCSTIIATVAINALHRHSPIQRMIVSTYQAVSGAGLAGIEELKEQVFSYSKGERIKNNLFQKPIAFNVIPQIESFDDFGYTLEEMKLHNESRKILHSDKLIVTCTCVRVPVFRSHSESIYMEFEDELSVETAKSLLGSAQGIKLVDDIKNNNYPTPLEASEQDLIFVGRIRQDLAKSNALILWCCGDQLRKGAATNAVQIAELLIERQFS